MALLAAGLLCVRRLVLFLPQTSTAATIRTEFLDKLVGNEDVQFYWCIAAANFDTEDVELHNLLLRWIADLYLTIRGFSYASAWIELYKQAKKKSTQRSKSLRKVYTDTHLS